MSFKSELQTLVRNHQNSLSEAIEKIETSKNSGDYTPQGLYAQVELINLEFQTQVERNRERGLLIVSNAEESFRKNNQENVVSHLHDPGYQAGLANVLKLIEKGALTEGDFKNVVEAYKSDSLSLKSIRVALGESRNGTALLQYLPRMVEDQLDVFEKLRKNIIKSIREVQVENNYGAQMGLSWLLSALDKLDDNLILSEGE